MLHFKRLAQFMFPHLQYPQDGQLETDSNAEIFKQKATRGNQSHRNIKHSQDLRSGFR